MDVEALINHTVVWDRASEIETWDDRIHLGHFYDSLSTFRPKRVLAVFALAPKRRLSDRAPYLPFVTIARFRSEYSIIEQVARSIAPAILQTGVVPIIQPVRQSEVEDLYEDSWFIQRILKRGIQVWSSSHVA